MRRVDTVPSRLVVISDQRMTGPDEWRRYKLFRAHMRTLERASSLAVRKLEPPSKPALEGAPTCLHPQIAGVRLGAPTPAKSCSLDERRAAERLRPPATAPGASKPLHTQATARGLATRGKHEESTPAVVVSHAATAQNHVASPSRYVLFVGDSTFLLPSPLLSSRGLCTAPRAS